MLEPVRASYRADKPLAWNRVHDLPDYVSFDHSIHVHKGVSCVACHGDVDQMPLTYRANTLHMEWCLDCHRHPERHVGPRDAVFTPAVRRNTSRDEALHTDWLATYHIQSKTNCSICHR